MFGTCGSSTQMTIREGNMHREGSTTVFTEEEDKVTDEKYIVFKRKEFEALIRDVTPGPHSARAVLEESLADATVIRGQDLFAAPALDSYANSISLAAMFMPLGDERNYLMSVADYFHRRADESRGIAFKTPDNGGHG